MFSLPGSSRQDRRRKSKSGFATKRESENTEARRRIKEQQKLELAKAGTGVAAGPPNDADHAIGGNLSAAPPPGMEPSAKERRSSRKNEGTAPAFEKNLFGTPLAYFRVPSLVPSNGNC